MTSTSKEYVQLAAKEDDDKKGEPDKDQIQETVFDGDRKTPSPIGIEEKEEKPQESELVRAARLGKIAAISDAVNGEDDLEPECLIEATKAGHMQVVVLIINSKKLSPDVKDTAGNNLLHFAAISDNLKLIDYLVEECEDQLDVNQKNDLEQTPLIAAVKNEKINSTKFLLSRISEIDAVDQDGHNAFSYACISGNELLCNLLLKSGSDPTIRYKLESYDKLLSELTGDVVEKSDEEEQVSSGGSGYSALFLSAWNGNYEAMLVLLKQLDQSDIESQIFEPMSSYNLNAIEVLMLAGKDNMLAHLLYTIPNELLQEQLSTRYFKGTTLAHCLYNLKCYHTLKIVFDKQVDQKQGSKKVQLRPGILESQEIPGYHWTMTSPTLLNRISTDKASELVNHPLIKAYADGKFPVYSFYPWFCLIYYLIFLFFLTFTIIHRAYAPNATAFESSANLFRLVCQIFLIIMVIGYILVSVMEQLISTYTAYSELERKETWLRMNKGLRFCCPGVCFKFGKAIRAFFRKLKNISKSISVYYCDIRNVIDVLGSVSLILLIPFWALNTQAQYLLASIVLLINYLRFFKATMYFSCHGRYTGGILKLFTGQYLKLIFILFIIILGFYVAIFPSLQYQQSSETMYDFLEGNAQGSIFTVLDQTLLAVPIVGPTSAKFVVLLILASLAFFAWLLLAGVLNAQFVHAYSEAFGLPHQYKLDVIVHIERRSIVSILSFMRRRMMKDLEVISIPFYYWDKYMAEDDQCLEGRDKHDSISAQIEDALNAGIYALDKRFDALRDMLEILTEGQNDTNRRIDDVHKEVIIVNQKVSQVGGLDLKDEMDRVVFEVNKVTNAHVKIEVNVQELMRKVDTLEADLALKLNEVQSEQRKHKLEINEELRKLGHGEDKDKETIAAARKIDTLSAQSQANHNETDRQLKEINNCVKRVEGDERQNLRATEQIVSVENDINKRITKLEKAVNLFGDRMNKD
ncbi:Ankyrin repeat domain-containing protein 50-like [Oopsacas minuta]|uniref:Ankyrin repeat domain-containing protein 50-like n=1 Tax=Oopsacas minuta TaxID=111878 RepID=A0AAV7K1X8_9METZ|nr:Ankyrin repeat domain-containing protein 50-like [Oopsacas minuta]